MDTSTSSHSRVAPPRGVWHAVSWVVTIAALGVGTLAAQTPAADTASGRELSRWLVMFNGSDREARQAFYRDRWAYRPNQAFYEDPRSARASGDPRRPLWP